MHHIVWGGGDSMAKPCSWIFVVASCVVSLVFVVWFCSLFLALRYFVALCGFSRDLRKRFSDLLGEYLFLKYKFMSTCAADIFEFLKETDVSPVVKSPAVLCLELGPRFCFFAYDLMTFVHPNIFVTFVFKIAFVCPEVTVWLTGQ